MPNFLDSYSQSNTFIPTTLFGRIFKIWTWSTTQVVLLDMKYHSCTTMINSSTGVTTFHVGLFLLLPLMCRPILSPCYVDHCQRVERPNRPRTIHRSAGGSNTILNLVDQPTQNLKVFSGEDTTLSIQVFESPPSIWDYSLTFPFNFSMFSSSLNHWLV